MSDARIIACSGGVFLLNPLNGNIVKSMPLADLDLGIFPSAAPLNSVQDPLVSNSAVQVSSKHFVVGRESFISELVSSESCLSTRQFRGTSESIVALAHVPLSDLVVTSGFGGDNALNVWSLRDDDADLRVMGSDPLRSHLRGHEDGVNSLLAHPLNDHTVVSVSLDATLRVWDISSETCLHRSDDPSDLWGLCCDHAHQMCFASSSQGDVSAWDMRTWQRIRRLPNPNDAFLVMDFRQDFSELILPGSKTYELTVLDTRNFRIRKSWSLNYSQNDNLDTTCVFGCCCCRVNGSDDDVIVTSGRIEGELKGWSMQGKQLWESGERSRTEHTHGITSFVGDYEETCSCLFARVDEGERLTFLADRRLELLNDAGIVRVKIGGVGNELLLHGIGAMQDLQIQEEDVY